MSLHTSFVVGAESLLPPDMQIRQKKLCINSGFET